MSKLIIDNQSSFSDLDAIEAVYIVMKQGRTSNNGKQYCYYTVFKSGECVASFLNKTSDRFVITDNGEVS